MIPAENTSNKVWGIFPASWMPHLAMVLQTLFVAPGYILGKPATIAFSMDVLMTIRIIGASLFYWLLLWLFAPHQLKTFRPTRSQWKQIFAFALVGTVLNQITFMTGLRYTTPAHSALLFSLVPLLVVLISVLILKSERMTWGKVLGVMLALAGVSWVILLSQPPNQSAADIRLGDSITILSVICWATYMANSRNLVQQFSPLIFITMLMSAGAVMVFPFGIYSVLTYDYSHISAEAWFGYFYLTIGSSAISYLLMIYALHRLHASRVSIYINAQPVVTALISFSIGTDHPTVPFVAGGILTVLGIYVLNKARY